MFIGRAFYPLTVVVLAFVIAGLVGWLARDSVNRLIGDRHLGPSAQWWQEMKGLDRIAAELIETDSGGTGQLSTAFTGAARRWLSEEFPGVEVMEAAMELGRDGTGENRFWRVFYRLRDDRQSVFQAMFCLDHDGARVECP